MRRTLPLATITRPPVIRIENATFYRHHPSSAPTITPPPPPAAAAADQHAVADANPPLFPGLTFSLLSSASPNQHWSVFGPSAITRTTLLHVLRGQHICLPPAARSYPYLASDLARLKTPANAIQYVGFDAERGGLGGTSTQGAYLSARYESRREATDFALMDYLLGNTELNPAEDMSRYPAQSLVDRVVCDLELGKLAQMPVSNLSNGQTRRARIAKALLAEPEVLLLDGPFMGLDPLTANRLAPLLHRLAEANEPRVVLSLGPKDIIPDWITHLLYVDERYNVFSQGPKQDVLRDLYELYRLTNSHVGKDAQDAHLISLSGVGRLLESTDTFNKVLSTPSRTFGAPQMWIGRTRPNIAKRLKPDHSNAVWVAKLIALGLRPRKAEKRTLRRLYEGLSAEQKRVYDQAKAEFEEDSLKAWTKFEQAVLRGNGEAEVPLGEPLVEMSGVQVKYGDKIVLGDWQQPDQPSPGLWWSLRRGQRYGIFGPNGSGKTTLLSLITSDHPQSYSTPLKLFGWSRLPQPGQPGISLFDIQARIGHSSPEVHAFFPKHLSVRRTIESAWADAPLARPSLSLAADLKIDAVLRWFQAELNPALGPTPLEQHEMVQPTGHFDDQTLILSDLHAQLAGAELDSQDLQWAESMRFGELTFSAQRVALFLRAIIKAPDLVVLDEAFSGMDETARIKCMIFLRYGERRALRYLTQLKTLRRPGPRVMESNISKCQKVKVEGLGEHQALIVVSHKREDVPDVIRDWMCLPEPGTGPPRFGRVEEPPEVGSMDGPRMLQEWEKIWGVSRPREIWRQRQRSKHPRQREDQPQTVRPKTTGPKKVEPEVAEVPRKRGRPKAQDGGYPRLKRAIGDEAYARYKTICDNLSNEQVVLLRRHMTDRLARLRREDGKGGGGAAEAEPEIATEAVARARLEAMTGEETYTQIEDICASLSDEYLDMARLQMTNEITERRRKAARRRLRSRPPKVSCT